MMVFEQKREARMRKAAEASSDVCLNHEGFSVRVRRDLATINLLPPRLYNRLVAARGNLRPLKNAKAQKA